MPRQRRLGSHQLRVLRAMDAAGFPRGLQKVFRGGAAVDVFPRLATSVAARPQTTRLCVGEEEDSDNSDNENDSEYKGGDGDVYSGSAEIGFQLECEHVIRGCIWHEGEHDFTKRHLWRAVTIGQLHWARIGEE